METADRIDAVAKLHRLFTHSNSGTDQLSKYLQQICKHWNDQLAPGATSFSITRSPEHIVPFDVALPLGLKAAELFSNSLKYAHPVGLPVKVMLSCTRAEPDRLTVAYEDDGVGFPDDFDPAHDGYLGMRFIRLLSKQLSGTYEWLSDPLGVRFEIIVPMVLPGSRKIPG
jgi:two-component sensor histidine kinase